MIFRDDDTVLDVVMRALIRASRHPSLQAPATRTDGLTGQALSVLSALGIDGQVPMRQWIETGDPRTHRRVQFGDAQIGDWAHTFEFKDKTKIFAEYGWVVDEEFFEDSEKGIILRKTWQLMEVEERNLEEEVCMSCDGEGVVVTGEHDPFCDETLCEKYGCSYEEHTCMFCEGRGTVLSEWRVLNVGPWVETTDGPTLVVETEIGLLPTSDPALREPDEDD